MAWRDLAGCPLVAAFAEAHRAIKKQIARTERIAFAPCHALPTEETEVVADNGIYPAGRNKFPVTWATKQKAPARGLGSQGQSKCGAYLKYAAQQPASAQFVPLS